MNLVQSRNRTLFIDDVNRYDRPFQAQNLKLNDGVEATIIEQEQSFNMNNTILREHAEDFDVDQNDDGQIHFGTSFTKKLFDILNISSYNSIITWSQGKLISILPSDSY